MADNQFLSNRTVSQGKPQDDQAHLSLFTARRYAIRGIHILSSCVSVRLSVCLSVTNRYCIETTRRIELIFGMGTSFSIT